MTHSIRFSARRSLALCIVAAALPISACGRGTETLVSPAGAPAELNAVITFWVADSSMSVLEVAVDGAPSGTLTQPGAQAPECGAPSSESALTMTVPAGSHFVTAQDSATGQWASVNIDVPADGCQLYLLSPATAAAGPVTDGAMRLHP